MLNLDDTTLQQVADKALIDAAAHPRWVAAIGRALVELDQNPWIERGDTHGLIIGSTSGKCYTSNGVCQCKAYEFKLPCWHRAAARLVRLHDEAIERDDDAGDDGNPDADYQAESYSSSYRATSRRISAARATALINELF